MSNLSSETAAREVSAQLIRLRALELTQQKVSAVHLRFLDSGNLDRAEQALRIWLYYNSAHPNAFIARLELARLLHWSGRSNQAMPVLREILLERENETWAHSLLGHVEIALGRLGTARTHMKRAWDLNPDNWEARICLSGDTLDQTLEMQRLLSHFVLSPHESITVQALCQAIDFKRGKSGSLEDGEITQQMFNRINLLLDKTPQGCHIDSGQSLRPLLDTAERILFYTSDSLGDTILGLAAVHAVRRYLRFCSRRSVTIEIVSRFADILHGLSQHDPKIQISNARQASDSVAERLVARDLVAREQPVFAFTNGGPDILNALNWAKRENPNVLAVTNIHIDRLARDIAPWRCTNPPYHYIFSYGARMYRFMEILLGTRLLRQPAEAIVRLPFPNQLKSCARETLRKYSLTAGHYHCLVESGSTRSKRLCHDQIYSILTRMCEELENGSIPGAAESKIVFSADPFVSDSFLAHVHKLPAAARRRIVPILETLPQLCGLLESACSVISPDTGIAHLAGALGRPTLVVFTVADPYLWTSGGRNFRFLASTTAMAAHWSTTPVNMLKWDSDEPIDRGAFEIEDVLDAWKSLLRSSESRHETNGNSVQPI